MNAPVPQILLMTDVAHAIRAAQAHVLAGQNHKAQALSRAVTAWLAGNQPEPLIASDGALRRCAVVVVAHRPSAGQATLLDTLCSLDPATYELILIENADGPIFPAGGIALGTNVTLFRLGCNTGASVARNIGLVAARAQAVVMIDDDGQTTPEDIARLLACFDRHGAVVVRGRVEPLTPGSARPPHYAPGEEVAQRFADIEGFTVLRRDAVLAVGGFDPILYGSEGMELSARLYARHGPETMLYDPTAVLRHDYAATPARLAEKEVRHKATARYAVHVSPVFARAGSHVWLALEEPAIAAALRLRRDLWPCGRVLTTPATVIVTLTPQATAAQLNQMIAALDRQSGCMFEVVLADGGAPFDLAAPCRCLALRIRHLSLPGADDRALREAAIAAARTDLCLFTDLTAPPLVDRVTLARAAHAAWPEMAAIGFALCTDQHPLTAAQPAPAEPSPLCVMAHTGPAAPLAGLSMRRDRLDADQLDLALAGRGPAGLFLPMAVAHRATVQRPGPDEVAQVAALHEALLGSPVDADAVAFLTTARQVTTHHQRLALRRHVLRLARHGSVDPALARALRDRCAAIESGLYHRLRNEAAKR